MIKLRPLKVCPEISLGKFLQPGVGVSVAVSGRYGSSVGNHTGPMIPGKGYAPRGGTIPPGRVLGTIPCLAISALRTRTWVGDVVGRSKRAPDIQHCLRTTWLRSALQFTLRISMLHCILVFLCFGVL